MSLYSAEKLFFLHSGWLTHASRTVNENALPYFNLYFKFAQYCWARANCFKFYVGIGLFIIALEGLNILPLSFPEDINDEYLPQFHYLAYEQVILYKILLLGQSDIYRAELKKYRYKFAN